MNSLRTTAVLVIVCFVIAQRAFSQAPAAPSGEEVASRLDALAGTISSEVTEALKSSSYKTSYTTVWRNIEDDAIAALCSSLKGHIDGLSDKNFDQGKTGSEKNRLADLAIVCGKQTIEVSVKAARKSQEPSNDIGTFREYPIRKRLFVGSFTLWLRYDDSGELIKVDRVFFDQTWRFVGKSTLTGGVKYRKKDGNMRPKQWAMFDSAESYWKTEEDFEAAVKKSASYRANSLVKEHLKGMSEEDQKLLYDTLKKKFEK